MKINFADRQYKNLIKMAEIGSNIYGILGDVISEEYKIQSDEIDELRKYLLSFAGDFNCENLTEEFRGETIMSDSFSEEMQEVMDDYDDETFWHELETRLGKRDFERTMTEIEEIKTKKDGWYPDRICDIYEKYEKEFEEYGIERLEIVSVRQGNS